MCVACSNIACSFRIQFLAMYTIVLNSLGWAAARIGALTGELCARFSLSILLAAWDKYQS